MQGALATAFIEPPLAQTEVRGENRGGVGVFQPICLTSNAFISVQQTSTGCLILKTHSMSDPRIALWDQSLQEIKESKVESDYLELLLQYSSRNSTHQQRLMTEFLLRAKRGWM